MVRHFSDIRVICATGAKDGNNRDDDGDDILHKMVSQNIGNGRMLKKTFALK
jgi:hypothetical protein